MPKIDPLFKIATRTLIKDHSSQFFQVIAYYRLCLTDPMRTGKKHIKPEEMDDELATTIQCAALTQRTLKRVEKQKAEIQSELVVLKAGIDEKIDSNEEQYSLLKQVSLQKEYEETVAEQNAHIQSIILSLIK